MNIMACGVTCAVPRRRRTGRSNVFVGLSLSRGWRVAFAVLAWIVCSATPARAVPACPQPVDVSQPDGTRLRLHARGDEFLHWTEDEAGYTVLRASKRDAWTYARRAADGSLEPSSWAVGRHDPATLGLPRRLLPAEGGARARAMAAGRHPRNRTASTSHDAVSASATADADGLPQRAPRTGTMKNLVVLVAFSDKPGTYTTAHFDALFNTIGYTADGAQGSVKDYYHQVSYNQLTVQSVVADWVTLDHDYAYYGANDAWGWDLRPQQMVSEALAKLEARGFDFSQFDNDADGWVDGLTIIHAGGGEEYGGNDEDYIWSHMWNMSSTVTYDGKRMYEYHTEPERRGWDSDPSSQGLTRIGVICHENGHFLGLPDLYDYGYDSSGVGAFCLMSGGSWNGDDGTQPALMSAWCKTSLEWVTPTPVDGSGVYTVLRGADNQSIYRMDFPTPGNQYFLVENRHGAGFDASLPGTTRGLLIWHVDEGQPDNDDQTHYLVDLEEASGTHHLQLSAGDSGDDADYFRSGTMTTFSSTTTPNNKSYANVDLGLDISSVSAAGASMTFTIPTVLPAPTGVTASDGAFNDRVAASWNSVVDATHYQLYRAATVSGLKTGISGWITATSFNDTTATPGVTYYYFVRAASGSNGEGVGSVSTYDTGWRALVAPTAVAATDGTRATDVRVTWTPPSGGTHARVYRADSPGGAKTAVSAWITATSFDDTTAVPAVTYYYSVVPAADSGGTRVGPSSGEDAGWRGLSAPTSVAATDGTQPDCVRVTWGSVVGAVRYQVYRAGTAGGAKTAISGWITGTSFDDPTGTPVATYYYSVRAALDDTGASPSAYSSEDGGWRPLFAPADLAASDGTLASAVRVTWTSQAGVYYKVSRATTAGGAKSVISGSAWFQGSSYDDASAVAGATYYYTAQAAVSVDGQAASGYSAEDSGWRSLSAPIGVDAADGTQAAYTRVSWVASSGATHYRLYRALSPGGARTPVGDWITATTMDDAGAGQGVPCYYSVQAALDGTGYRPSDYSAEDVGWRAQAAPTGVTASDGTYSGFVRITWDAVASASYYRVARAASPGGGKTVLSGWITDRTFDDTTATAGVTYYYSAQAAAASDGAGASSYSTENAGFRGMAPPTNVSATDGSSSSYVQITWSAVSGASHYRVYRATSPGGTQLPLGSTWITSTSYSDPSTRGVSFYYWVKAATSSSGANPTDYSAMDEGWRAVSAPSSVTASDGAHDGLVRVTWATVGVSCYRIWRATSAGGAKTPLTGWSTYVTLTYDDTTAVPGITYFYSVQAAYDAAAVHPSVYSIEDSGRAAGDPPPPPAFTALGTAVGWLERYNLSVDTQDDDLDGLLTWQEYIVGCNPTNGDCFAVQSCTRLADGRPVLRWASSTNGVTEPYLINYRTSLLPGDWLPAGISPRTPPLNVWTGAPGISSAFYRVVATNSAAP